MSTKYIRIEGEAVIAVEETIVRQTALPEWLAAINKLSPVVMATPVLPVGTALFAQKGQQQLIAINQPAAVKKVIWRTEHYRNREERNKTRWQLAIPPHVFLLIWQDGAIRSSHLYYVPAPVATEKDMLFFTNLANIYYQPTDIPNPICTGSIRLDVKAPLAERCQKFIDSFWETEFNDDIVPIVQRQSSGCCVFAKESPKELLNLNAWDKATADSPDFLAKMDWPFALVCSLETILNERWQGQ